MLEKRQRAGRAGQRAGAQPHARGNSSPRAVGNDACAHKPNQPPTLSGLNYLELHATNRPVLQNEVSRFMRTSEVLPKG